MGFERFVTAIMHADLRSDVGSRAIRQQVGAFGLSLRHIHLAAVEFECRPIDVGKRDVRPTGWSAREWNDQVAIGRRHAAVHPRGTLK